jgi:hypothetical protein
MFSSEVAPMLQHLFKGENASIFAYGMTGAGKTFTMQGSTGDHAGIIPRSVRWVFEHMRHLSERFNVPFGSDHLQLQLSCMEIYNEKTYDLISPKDQDLPIREDANRNIFVPNLAQVIRILL